jgi:hypothetical protein
MITCEHIPAEDKPNYNRITQIYFETGWEKRNRKRGKFNMFHKIRNNNALSYLFDCLLPCDRNENEYNLRN